MKTPVQIAVTRHYRMSLEEIRGSTRGYNSVLARHVAHFLERELFKRSYPEIGRLYNRDHTSIMAAFNHVTDRLAHKDERYVGPVAAVSRAVRDLEAQGSVADVFDALKCPVCGGHVIEELRRQIVTLQEQVAALVRPTGETHGRTQNGTPSDGGSVDAPGRNGVPGAGDGG